MDVLTAGAPVPQPKNPSGKVRKRAAKACLSCRARKVRCDVSQRGRPCMNCYLDSETCVVTGRASRLRRAREEDEGGQTSHTAAHASEAHGHVHDYSEESPSGAGAHQQPSFAPELQRRDRTTTPGAEDVTGTHAAAILEPLTPVESVAAQSAEPLKNHVGATQPADLNLDFHFSESSVPPILHWNNGQNVNYSSDITYSYYPFLSVSNLSNILPQDVNYLDMQGCLRVPTRAILDEMVQQYFLHVHPYFPLFNEGDFWEQYSHPGKAGPAGHTGPTDKIPLLVFQAMLFATCNFLSRASVKALGFPTIRATRASFYRRAKLLYDFETESSPLATAQAALLLSFWSSAYSTSGTKRPNSFWLSTAIEQAKSAEAHRYYSLLPGPGPHAPRLLKRQNTLKRLWWCCVIRDRILALGVRRSVQITPLHFDFEAHAPLSQADLADEVDRSRVYNPGTKRSLIGVLGKLVELCVLLTDVLMLVFPLDDVPGWGRQRGEEGWRRVERCKDELRRWYEGALVQCPMAGSDQKPCPEFRKEYQHDSVVLYTNLMYTYYHSSRVVLCHHEILTLAAAMPDLDSRAPQAAAIYEKRHEIQDAASSVTECFKELTQRRLARWLPISAVTCVALPLVLHILDVKLSRPAASSSPSSTAASPFDPTAQSALKQHRLNVLIEVMRSMQPQYDGVDWVSEAIRHIITLAQVDDDPSAAGNNNNNSGAGAGAAVDWTDILATHPGCYLRLALTIDLSLSKNRLPEERDFPASLRGLFAGGGSPIRRVLLAREKAKKQQQQQEQQQAAATTGPSPQMLADWAANDQSVAFGMEAGVMMDADGGPGAAGLMSSSSAQDAPFSAGGGGGALAAEANAGFGDVSDLVGQAFAEAMDMFEGNMFDSFGFHDGMYLGSSGGGADGLQDTSEGWSPSDGSLDDAGVAGGGSHWVNGEARAGGVGNGNGSAGEQQMGDGRFSADQVTAMALMRGMDGDAMRRAM